MECSAVPDAIQTHVMAYCEPRAFFAYRDSRITTTVLDKNADMDPIKVANGIGHIRWCVLLALHMASVNCRIANGKISRMHAPFSNRVQKFGKKNKKGKAR